MLDIIGFNDNVYDVKVRRSGVQAGKRDGKRGEEGKYKVIILDSININKRRVSWVVFYFLSFPSEKNK